MDEVQRTGSWQRVPDARWRSGGGEVLVRHAGSLHRLGGPAAAMWLLLDRPLGVTELAAEVSDPRQAAAIAEVLARLAGVGIVERVAS